MELKDELFEEFSPVENEKSNANEGGMVAARKELPPVKLPFPESDYDKKGNLKKVRGRMLKKLLKAEFKHYLPLTLAFMGILLLTAIFCGLGLRSSQGGLEQETYIPDSAWITSLLLFIGCLVGAVAFAAVYPIARYNKNFFQNEGYLTFSIPASVEEHVFAKRLAAVLCSYAMTLVAIIAIFLAVLISGDMELPNFNEVGIFSIFNEAYLTGGNAVVHIVECLISAMIGGIMMPSLYAVLTCLLSKSAGKRKTATTIFLVFIGVAILDSFGASFLTTENLFPDTALWSHLLAWFSIALQAAFTVGCIWFEIWYLKNKLDLK